MTILFAACTHWYRMVFNYICRYNYFRFVSVFGRRRRRRKQRQNAMASRWILSFGDDVSRIPNYHIIWNAAKQTKQSKSFSISISMIINFNSHFLFRSSLFPLKKSTMKNKPRRLNFWQCLIIWDTAKKCIK